TITLNGASSYDPDGSIALAQWSFGDGTSAGGLTVAHAYGKPGTYTATLTVVDNRGTAASDTAVVTVANRAPVANAGPDTGGAPGVALTLDGGGPSDRDGPITGWAWPFGDGAGGSGVAPSHVYAAAGTYTATLTVTDDKGATGRDTATVTIAGGTAST